MIDLDQIRKDATFILHDPWQKEEVKDVADHVYDLCNEVERQRTVIAALVRACDAADALNGLRNGRTGQQEFKDRFTATGYEQTIQPSDYVDSLCSEALTVARGVKEGES